MALKKGFSADVVSQNIKEMVKSGFKPKQAIASALSSKRKYKKMAEGGEVEDQSGEDMVQPQRPSTPAPGSGMDKFVKGFRKATHYSEGGMVEGMEDEAPRDLAELNDDSQTYPQDIANPEELDESLSFAKALRKQAMNSYAMGGLVQSGPEEDEKLHGNHPENIMDGGTEEPMSAEPMKPSASFPDKEPSGMALSEEAKAALRLKRMSRKYGMYNPS